MYNSVHHEARVLPDPSTNFCLLCSVFLQCKASFQLHFMLYSKPAWVTLAANPNKTLLVTAWVANTKN